MTRRQSIALMTNEELIALREKLTRKIEEYKIDGDEDSLVAIGAKECIRWIGNELKKRQ